MHRSVITSLTLAAPLALLGVAPADTATTRAVRVGDNWFVRPAGVPTVTVRRPDASSASSATSRPGSR